MQTRYFNPLPRKEGDRFNRSDRSERNYFNPLPRKEGDVIIVSTHIVKQHFNPLPRKEGDPEEFDWADFYGSISIHSLVKRETPASRPPNQSKTHFNPLPRKEGDCSFIRYCNSVSYFNPLPRKEGDRKYS